MKPTRNLYGIHNDFCGVGGGLRRGCILIRNRDGDDDVHLHLHTCLMLRNRMFLSDLDTCLMLRHRMFLSDLHTCLMLRNRMFHVGVGWGGVGMMTFICICTHV